MIAASSSNATPPRPGGAAWYDTPTHTASPQPSWGAVQFSNEAPLHPHSLGMVGVWGEDATYHSKEEGVAHTLVLDMDETLLHTSFERTAADIVLDITVEGVNHTAYVRKRPHVEYFIRKCCEMFDVVVWTASLRDYAEPLIKKLLHCAGIPESSVRCLYRGECTEIHGNYVKDLSKLVSPLHRVCIVDNSPVVACLQPANLIPVSSWYNDVNDVALLDLLPFLERVQRSTSIYDILSRAQAVRSTTPGTPDAP